MRMPSTRLSFSHTRTISNKKQALYLSSSDEYAQIEKERELTQQQRKYDLQKQHDEQLLQLRQEYGKLGNEEQMQLELQGLEAIYKAGLIREEEYQRTKMGIANKYASYKPTADEQRKEDANTALDTAKKMTKATATTVMPWAATTSPQSQVVPSQPSNSKRWSTII